MEPSDQQHGSIDPLACGADQSLPVPNGSLEEAKVEVATPHTSAIHTQLEVSTSFDDWKACVLAFYDSSAVLPF